MSGIYIKGMEMPNKKNGAVLIIYPDGKCAFEDGKTYQAVPVPPHGRLIDADNLRQSIVECSLRVKAAPTIIPADPAEESE